MKTQLLAGIISLVFLTSCAGSYQYRLPAESDKAHYAPDSLRWRFSGSKPVEIPVIDAEGIAFRLPVTPTLKIEVKTTEGLTYRFYLESVAVTGEGSFMGDTQMWRGYDLLSHTDRTVFAKDVTSYIIISDNKAASPIGK